MAHAISQGDRDENIARGVAESRDVVLVGVTLSERLEAVTEDPGLAGARFGLAGKPGGDSNPPRE